MSGIHTQLVNEGTYAEAELYSERFEVRKGKLRYGHVTYNFEDSTWTAYRTDDGVEQSFTSVGVAVSWILSGWSLS